MNSQRSGRKNKNGVMWPLEEAASQLSLDSLRDHKKRSLLFEFFKGEMHLSQGICLTTNVSGKSMFQLLLPVN